jgi:hypothetical protein
MDADLHRRVRERSGGRCEYCPSPEADSLVPFEIEHIIPRKHRGRTVAGNLGWACIYCNGYKGPNLTGRDPTTGKESRHPRTRRSDHSARASTRPLRASIRSERVRIETTVVGGFQTSIFPIITGAFDRPSS